MALTLLLLGAICLSGCKEIPADRLYALRLETAPTESDWERALPRLVTVRGGRLHKDDPLPEINRDTVHTSTPSCHHGGRLPDPIAVDMRAFYTDSELFLRLSWIDATPDDAMYRWVFDGHVWRNEAHLEDGFGLIWADPAEFDRFTCAYACHIADFGVAAASFHANNRMKLAEAGRKLDLWNWKADRTARLGFADDRWIDDKGMHGDTPGELYRQNSLAAQQQLTQPFPFSEKDRPLTDEKGRPADAGFHPPGSTAPGYLVSAPRGHRADVGAQTRHEDGRWIVTLRRRLATGDPRDHEFRPGISAATVFGLSIMDHTLSEHYASTLVETLVLLRAGENPEHGVVQ